METPNKFEPMIGPLYADDLHIKHFASRNYKLTQAELENLGETLFNFINRDFKPVMQIILKNNYPNLKIGYLES